MINYADYKIKVNDHPEGPSKICQLGGDRTILPLLEKIELVDFKEDKGVVLRTLPLNGLVYKDGNEWISKAQSLLSYKKTNPLLLDLWFKGEETYSISPVIFYEMRDVAITNNYFYIEILGWWRWLTKVNP